MTGTTRGHVGCVIALAMSLGVMAGGRAEASLARNAAVVKSTGDVGALTMDTAGALESDPDGKVWSFEAAFQYQLSRRLQLLAEAVPVTIHEPDGGERTSGFGDTDVTMSWLVSGGNARIPDIVLGAKVKIPTARAGELGTGRPDVSALVIASREYGELELNLETEFAKFGQAGDERLKDQVIYAFSAEYSLNDFMAVYGEVSGNSRPTASESRTDAARLGAELDFRIGRLVAPYVTFEASTENDVAIRSGIEWTW